MRWLQNHCKIFYFGLIAKLLLSFFFASYYLSELFMPFVNYFVESGFSNPYEQFINSQALAQFPYPALMLYILSIPKLLFGFLAFKHTGFELFIYRLPLICADLTIYSILRSWLKPVYHKRLLWFYWLSPVLIYISYIHGQLDAIPIAFLLASLFFLFKDQLKKSALFLACATSTKFSVILALPFILIYLYSKRYKLQKQLLFIMLVCLFFVLLNCAFILNHNFIDMVFNNQEQAKVLLAKIKIQDLSFYLIPSAVLILLLKAILIKNFNLNIFMMLLGSAFSILLLFIPPMPGWYFWLIPFICFFYVQRKSQSQTLYFILQILCLSYFALSQNTPVNESLNQDLIQWLHTYLHSFNIDLFKLKNIVFTLLQTCLIFNIYWIYQKGLERNQKNKIFSKPFLIGIGGNSGVGKSILSSTLKELFTSNLTTVIRGDDMHKWQRGDENWKALTHLNPKANYLHEEVHFLKKLKSGQKIFRRSYDHIHGTFTSEKTIHAKNIIIYEGLHPFYLPKQRQLYDLKIFIEPEYHLMCHWKIIRDMKKRGYDKQTILNSIAKRKDDSEKYIEPQSKQADILIHISSKKPIESLGCESENIELQYTLKLSNDVYLEPLNEVFKNIPDLNFSHSYTDAYFQTLQIHGHIGKSEQLSNAYKKLLPGLVDLGILQPNIKDDRLFALIVLVITFYIFEKGKNE